MRGPVEPEAPLDIPVRSLPAIPEYVMSSAPISTVPSGKPVVSIKVMLVADPLLPLAS